MDLKHCPICSSDADVIPNPSRDRHFVECLNCKPFEISRSACDDKGGKFSLKKAAILSHAVFKMHDRDDCPWLDNYNIDSILESRNVPGHIEQADNLILFIGSELDREASPGGSIVGESYGFFRAAMGAVRKGDVNFIIQELDTQGIIRIGHDGEIQRKGKNVKGVATYGLTFKGWDRYRDLMAQGTTARIAFMAMQYGDSVLDKMYENCFRPAVTDTGFDLRRLDHVPKAGVIDNILRAEILNSQFLIADLTHGNRGAYWEGGYAEGLGKPVIYLCEKSVFDDEKKQPHFDTNHCQTVVWEEGKQEECAMQLKNTIRVTLPGAAKQTDD